MRFAVIIPSRIVGNLTKCMQAVRRWESRASITVVDDGLDHLPLGVSPDCLVLGAKPFIYARNINIGVRAARERFNPDAFILLNDDALLVTPGGFSQLMRDAEALPEYGAIAAVSNHVGNVAQRPQSIGLREEPRMLCFICVLITRAAMDAVGELDERFVAYGWEDNDYCRRIRAAGFRLGIDDRCYVDHGSLTSTFRGNPNVGLDVSAGREIYRAKWGDVL